jgi:uncharacterized membrane protein YraQ (UPF0718 family)
LHELLQKVVIVISSWMYIISQTRTFSIFWTAWELISGLWYWLFGSVIITSAIMTYVSSATITQVLKKLKGWDLILAVFLGMISPLGTYAVVPIIAVLISAGAPLSPLCAFLISSPLMNPTIFILTLGGLGVEMAIARVLSTMTLALAAGLIIRYYEQKWQLPEDVLRETDDIKPVGCFKQRKKLIEGYRAYKDENTIEENVHTPFSWADNFRSQSRFVVKFFLLAILVSATINELIPTEIVASVLGSGSLFSVFIAAIAGMPLHVCGGAAVPVMQVLSDLGMSKGAVLAFFITGPATNVSTVLIMSVLFKPKLLVIYYSTIIGGALLMGYIYHLI